MIESGIVRRTKELHIGLLASIAAATLAMAGCRGCGTSHAVSRRCVDGSVTVVEDRYCDGPVSTSGSYPYRWYYGGSSSYARTGQSVAGGSFDKPAGASAGSHSVSSGSVRGVFGGSAGHGAGG
jgi:hypothetical protein